MKAFQYCTVFAASLQPPPSPLALAQPCIFPPYLPCPLQISQKRAQTWCQSKGGIPYFETSAKESVNVEQAFETIAANALQQEKDADYFHDFKDQIVLDAKDQPKQDGCGC